MLFRSQTIRELGSVPSGHLYARVMDTLSLSQYQQVIGLLKREGLVLESGHLLTWAEPEVRRASTRV